MPAATLGPMTLLGILAFFGMAVVTMDVLGGVLAATFLARRMPPPHLLYFVGAYVLSATVATIALKPILGFLGRALAPVLGSEVWLAIVQLVVGLALLGFALYQRSLALHPRPPREKDVRDRAGSLVAGGFLFSLTTFADPAFTVAVGMAMGVHHLALEILLLVLWNAIYQIPLLTVTIASLFGAHHRVLAWFARTFGPHRRLLLLSFAGVLLIAGLVVLIDGTLALLHHQHSWLQALLLREERHA